jgi:hypothetical protein
MKREIQGRYVTISTVGEKAQAFVPAPLPPRPPVDWTPGLRSNRLQDCDKPFGIRFCWKLGKYAGALQFSRV